jgi:hypothetical protein
VAAEEPRCVPSREQSGLPRSALRGSVYSEGGDERAQTGAGTLDSVHAEILLEEAGTAEQIADGVESCRRDRVALRITRPDPDTIDEEQE